MITTIDVGGAEHHLLSLCRGLVDLGYEVDVVFLKGRATLRSRFQDLGIEPRRAETERFLGYFFAALSLWRLCRQRRYHVVHTHLLKADTLGAVAARLAGIDAIIASKHNDEPQLRHPLVAWVHRWVSKLDQQILHASQHIADYMIRVGGVPEEKSRVLHYGVDPEALAAKAVAGIRRQRDLDKGTFVLVCVARLIRRKGHLQLLEAFRRAVEATPTPMELWIVGDGAMAGEIHSQVEKLELHKQVWMAGERLDVASILKEADAFVLASTHEGLGLVLLEAMASRLAVLATNTGGMPELVQDGVTGRLVPRGDPEALMQAILEVADHPEQRQRWAEAGYRRLRDELSHRHMMAEIVEVYDSERSSSLPIPFPV